MRTFLFKKNTAFFFAIVILLSFNSCKKESVLAEANFTFSGNLDAIPAQIQFTNNSFGISYVWDFGDGTSSNEKSPSHTYNEYGLYKVKLTAKGSNNIDTMVKDLLIGGNLGQIGGLNCSGSFSNTNFKIGETYSDEIVQIPYTSGNGGVYNSFSVNSTGVLGLNATLNRGKFNNGNGTLELLISGTASSKGTAKFKIDLVGKSCEINLFVADTLFNLPANGLIGWWPFNGNANDESGNGHHLIKVGDVTLSKDRFNNINSCYYFKTSEPESKFDLPKSFYPNFNNLKNATISFWFNLNTFVNHDHYFNFDNVFFAKQTHGVISDSKIGLLNGKIRFHMSGGFPAPASYVDSKNILENKWYNLTISWSSNTLKIYIDGDLSSSYTGSFGISNTLNPSFISIGGFSGTGGTGCFSHLDNFGIWNRTLSDVEIKEIYNLK